MIKILIAIIVILSFVIIFLIHLVNLESDWRRQKSKMNRSFSAENSQLRNKLIKIKRIFIVLDEDGSQSNRTLLGEMGAILKSINI